MERLLGELFDGGLDETGRRKLAEEIERDPGYIDATLRQGALRANELANATLGRVRQAMGL